MITFEVAVAEFRSGTKIQYQSKLYEAWWFDVESYKELCILKRFYYNLRIKTEQ